MYKKLSSHPDFSLLEQDEKDKFEARRNAWNQFEIDGNYFFFHFVN